MGMPEIAAQTRQGQILSCIYPGVQLYRHAARQGRQANAARCPGALSTDCASSSAQLPTGFQRCDGFAPVAALLAERIFSRATGILQSKQHMPQSTLNALIWTRSCGRAKRAENRLLATSLKARRHERQRRFLF